MKKITNTTKKIKSHPLEDAFGIEPNTTEMIETTTSTELNSIDSYDKKDEELEDTYQDVYDKAINTFEKIIDELDDIEPKYYARNYEVANQFLELALKSGKSKADLKAHKDKILEKMQNGTKSAGTRSGGNNVLIVNTSELIKQMQMEIEEDVIDLESKRIEQDKSI